MSDLHFYKLGYRRCKKCDSLVPKEKLNKSSLCFNCAGNNHTCFFCGSRKVKMFRHVQFGLTWICNYCKRRDDEEWFDV